MRPKITLGLNPYDHFLLSYQEQETSLKQAMVRYPNARTFTIVTTNSKCVFSFIPNHLTRFIPESATQLFTMNYPRDIDPLTALELEAEKLRNNIPNRIILSDAIAYILCHQTRISQFHDITTAIELAKEYTPEFVTLMTYHHGEITKQFLTRLAPYLNRERKQFKSLGVTIDNDTDVVITLSGKPLESENVVWEWLRLTPENADNLSREKCQEKQKILCELSNAISRLSHDIAYRTKYVHPVSYVYCCNEIQKEIHYEAGDHL